MTTSSDVSPRIARILQAARELTLRGGVDTVTISEIAKRAGVGRGTLYLYWTAKEDLLADLFAHDFLDVLSEVESAVQDDPSLLAPRRLLPLVGDTFERHPFVSAAQSHSEGLLRVVTSHPGIVELTGFIGPMATLMRIFPVLRRHGVVRDDLDLETQVYATSGLLYGLHDVADREPVARLLPEADPQSVLEQICSVLLEPTRAPDPSPALAEAVSELHEARSQALDALRRHGLGKTQPA